MPQDVLFDRHVSLFLLYATIVTMASPIWLLITAAIIPFESSTIWLNRIGDPLNALVHGDDAGSAELLLIWWGMLVLVGLVSVALLGRTIGSQRPLGRIARTFIWLYASPGMVAGICAAAAGFVGVAAAAVVVAVGAVFLLAAAPGVGQAASDELHGISLQDRAAINKLERELRIKIKN